MFSLNEKFKKDKTETEEVFQFLFPFSLERTQLYLSFIILLLIDAFLDVSAVHDVFVLDDAGYAIMDERTERNPTAKFIFWMWFNHFNRNTDDDIFSMLGSFYESKNLFLNRENMKFNQSTIGLLMMLSRENSHKSNNPLSPPSNLGNSYRSSVTNMHGSNTFSKVDSTLRALALSTTSEINTSKETYISRLAITFVTTKCALLISTYPKEKFHHVL